MVKVSLIVAILYFLSPIALTKIQAPSLGGEENHLAFFQPPQMAAMSSDSQSLPIASNSQISREETIQALVAAHSAEKPQTVGLCSGDLSLSASVTQFCSAISADQLNGHIASEVMSSEKVAKVEVLVGCERVVREQYVPATNALDENELRIAQLDRAVSDWLIAMGRPADEQTQSLQENNPSANQCLKIAGN